MSVWLKKNINSKQETQSQKPQNSMKGTDLEVEDDGPDET